MSDETIVLYDSTTRCTANNAIGVVDGWFCELHSLGIEHLQGKKVYIEGEFADGYLKCFVLEWLFGKLHFNHYDIHPCMLKRIDK